MECFRKNCALALRKMPFLWGTGLVAEILNSVKKNVEGEILTALETKDPDVAEEIRGKMFVFEDLENIDDRGMQELLREVSKEELLLALKPVEGPFAINSLTICRAVPLNP